VRCQEWSGLGSGQMEGDVGEQVTAGCKVESIEVMTISRVPFFIMSRNRDVLLKAVGVHFQSTN